MTNTTEAAESRRTQILEVAAMLFAEKGYQRATVKEIADRVGIAPGTIYLYFGGKREILSTIATETEIPMVAALLEVGSLGGREAIVEMIEKGMDITEAQLPFNRTLLSEVWVDDGILEEAVAERVKRIHRLLQDHIAERIAAGFFRPVDPALVAQMVLGMFAGLVLPAIRGLSPLPSPEKRRALAEAMVDLLLDGLRAQDKNGEKES
jgi:AcrR family transcriptional regulator